MKDQIKNITQEQAAELAGLLRYLLNELKQNHDTNKI